MIGNLKQNGVPTFVTKVTINKAVASLCQICGIAVVKFYQILEWG
jgi:hypothetical protein